MNNKVILQFFDSPVVSAVFLEINKSDLISIYHVDSLLA